MPDRLQDTRHRYFSRSTILPGDMNADLSCAARAHLADIGPPPE
jgi:hypothetical protein